MSLLSKTIIPASLIASCIGSVSFAEESKGWYFTAGAGLTSISDVTATAASTSVAVEIESGASYEAGFGYNFGNDLRTEITWGQSRGDFEKVAGTAVTAGDVVASTISANVFKDFSSESKFTPYIGAGIGTTDIDTGNITISGTTYTGTNETSTSYSLKFGSKYQMSDQTDVFLEGRLASIGDFTVNNVKYTDISTFGAHLGVNFKF